MGTAKQDFERFVHWLHEPEQHAPEPARRFANLILQNFPAVAGAARQHNNRSNLLARLARRQLAATPADLPEIEEVAARGEWPWVRLRHLTLGPFRGFREPQGFNLNKRVVLCYGPNGSGKSSLCEALEYALLDSVEEAGSRRIAGRDYLANIHAGRFEAPALTATGSDGREVQVRADENAFRFFFIEKNRIDSFSRIAATPPGRKTDLIATLFGMDQFNDFASRFNDSMDASLTLGTQTQTQLNEKRQALARDRATAANEATLLAEMDQVAAEYSTTFAEGLSFERLIALIGNEEAPGRLQELEAKLRAVPPALTGISRDRLLDLYDSVRSNRNSVAAAAAALEDRRGQISFRDLFAAVQALQAVYAEHCPACLTPIAEAAQNPFERATAGLRDLAELAEFEAQHQALVQTQADISRSLRTYLLNLEEFLVSSNRQDSIVGPYLSALPRNPGEAGDWWASVLSPETDETGRTPALEELLQAADDARARDDATQEALAARAADIAEQGRLNDARVWIAGHETRRNRVVEDAAQARIRIAQWEEANADLIQRSAEEAEANVRDQPIKEAYESFFEFLNLFRERLPGMLMADLNATTMELYNEFNHGDRDEDKLADLLLPLTGNDTIEVTFRGVPERRVNALSVLSEGHIRCLGLAILLAKAQSVGAPLIIFDDAINAIDHDHRSGIRAAIFESDRFRETQIIVTCHSPEFVKDIENHLPRVQRADCQQYVLLHHNGDHQPRVNPDVGTTNYLVRARQALDRFDPRDALSFSRKALEMLSRKSWKWLESHRVGNISVQVEGPGKEPQLRNLCDALRIQLARIPTFNHPSKEPLLEGFQEVLGIPEQTLVWTLLNKGTHEEPDRDDFDLQHVETVLRVLESIDRLELRPGR